MTSAEELDRLRAAGDLLWENHCYGATYAIGPLDASDGTVCGSTHPDLRLHTGMTNAERAAEQTDSRQVHGVTGQLRTPRRL